MSSNMQEICSSQGEFNTAFDTYSQSVNRLKWRSSESNILNTLGYLIENREFAAHRWDDSQDLLSKLLSAGTKLTNGPSVAKQVIKVSWMIAALAESQAVKNAQVIAQKTIEEPQKVRKKIIEENEKLRTEAQNKADRLVKITKIEAEKALSQAINEEKQKSSSRELQILDAEKNARNIVGKFSFPEIDLKIAKLELLVKQRQEENDRLVTTPIYCRDNKIIEVSKNALAQEPKLSIVLHNYPGIYSDRAVLLLLAVVSNPKPTLLVEAKVDLSEIYDDETMMLMRPDVIDECIQLSERAGLPLKAELTLLKEKHNQSSSSFSLDLSNYI